MDRSVDSIGSCSLDVDADSSDISDTSESLNFPTPLSIKDITREFTANIRERCSVHKIQTITTFIDPMTSKIRTEVTQQPAGSATSPSAFPQISIEDSDNPEKKPSYLSLACCVNGYSNLTTYDSKIRQDINKSREVSPIRPSTNGIQFCKNSKSLTPPKLEKVPAQSYGNYSAKSYKSTAYLEFSPTEKQGMECEGRPSRTFVQQRVERLYGPGALAQGFYKQNSVQKTTPQKLNNSSFDDESDEVAASELSLKFKQLSPSKNYSNFRKKLSENSTHAVKETNGGGMNGHQTSPGAQKVEKNNIDLPVLRHLSKEFRAQLPIVSPKHCVNKNANSQSPGENSADSQTNGTTALNYVSGPTAQRKLRLDEVDHQISYTLSDDSNGVGGGHGVGVVSIDNLEMEIHESKPASSKNNNNNSLSATNANMKSSHAEEHNQNIKDGNYFLRLLKTEQDRLLALADETEEYLNSLMNNTEITEDVLGLLRSASGKARLLVSQKMKQFEGLCHKNLSDTPGDGFVTKIEDLQGFWDMVYLQVDEVDSQFATIQAIKNNGWKKLDEADSLPTKSIKSNKTAKSRAVTGNKTTNGSTPATKLPTMSASAMKRESQRKQLLEMKRKKKLEMELAAKSTKPDEVHGDAVPTNGALEKANATSASKTVEIFINQNDS